MNYFYYNMTKSKFLHLNSTRVDKYREIDFFMFIEHHNRTNNNHNDTMVNANTVNHLIFTSVSFLLQGHKKS